jgi:hypothetical protein
MPNIKLTPYKILLATTLCCYSTLTQAADVDFSSNLVSGQYQKCIVTALKPYMNMLKNNLLWADRTLGDLGDNASSSPEAEPILDLNTSQDRYIKSIKGMKVSTDVKANNNNSNDGYTSYYYEIKFDDMADMKAANGTPCIVLSNHSYSIYPHYLNWSKENGKLANRSVLLNGPVTFYMNTDTPAFSLQGKNNNGYNGPKAKNGVCMLDNANTALHNAFSIAATFNIGQRHAEGDDTLDPNECFASVVSRKILRKS